MELNPDHPVTRAVHDHWHVIVGVLINKLGTNVTHPINGRIEREIVITKADIDACQTEGSVLVQELEDGIHLRLVDPETARQLVQLEGAKPIGDKQ